MTAHELTQTVNQRVQLWIDGALKSSHLSEGEAASKASLIRKADPALKSAKYELKWVGIKLIEWIDDPAPVPAPLTVDALAGTTVKVGLQSDNPAVAVASGEIPVSIVGDGEANFTPVLR